jgi:polyisoprenoid-binding protein YceI
MKTIALITILFLFGASINAQDKKMTKTGHLWFFSHTSIEDIEAHSHQAVAILVPAKGSLAIEVSMLSFEFKKALMQEHFNENYMESAKYPKAKFLGTITNVSNINFAKDGTYNATVEGTLTIHNVPQKIKADGTVEVKAGKITLKSKFNVAPKDYNIAIESRFANNIASSIEVNVDLTL